VQITALAEASVLVLPTVRLNVALAIAQPPVRHGELINASSIGLCL